MTGAVAQHFLCFVFGSVGGDTKQVNGVHPVPEMFRAGCLDGLFGRVVSLLRTGQNTIGCVQSVQGRLSALAQLVKF